MQKLRFLSLAVSMAMASLIDTKKVTKDFLESEIDKVEYNRLGGTLTHCTIYTHDGFTFTGESACVDPEQFNEEIGRQIAYKVAFDKMYMENAGIMDHKMVLSTLKSDATKIKDPDVKALADALAMEAGVQA